MEFEWDLSEFEQFAANLQDRSAFDINMRNAIRRVARILHKNLLARTPIDTGNLRNMWNAGDNLQFTVKMVNNGYMVTLYNRAYNNKSPKYPNFQYGLAVNDGHYKPGGTGWVVGKFFVEKSIAITAQQVEQIIMKELQKWWNSI